MKTILTSAAWLFVAGAILVAALSPVGGLIYHDPITCLGLGLIGFGLSQEVRKARARAATAE